MFIRHLEVSSEADIKALVEKTIATIAAQNAFYAANICGEVKLTRREVAHKICSNLSM
jgi:hypothetical protein